MFCREGASTPNVHDIRLSLALLGMGYRGNLAVAGSSLSSQ